MNKCEDCEYGNYWTRECPADAGDIMVENENIVYCNEHIFKTCNSDEQPAETKDNPVDHPTHYTQGGIECIEAIKASMTAEQYRGYLKGNLLKYVWRYEQKGKPAEDLKKARWYLDRLLAEVMQE